MVKIVITRNNVDFKGTNIKKFVAVISVGGKSITVSTASKQELLSRIKEMAVDLMR